MKQNELIKAFLNLKDEDEEMVEACALFIETQRAYRDVEARVISRREGDSVRRKFIKYMGQHRLKTVNEEKGLGVDEFAIVKEGGSDEAAIKPLNQIDLWLLADFEEVCTAWMTEDFTQVPGLTDKIIAFLNDPQVEDLKERLVERDTERGERILRKILEDNPSEMSVHALLVKIYEKADRVAEAEAEYKRFLSVTDDEVVWANYGDFLEKRGRYEDAFEAFKESFEVCERIGREGKELGEIAKRSINRVERMKNLKGEEAKKAREYQEAVWWIEEIRGFTEKTLVKEIRDAQEEFREEEGIEKVGFADLFDFLNWFSFTRTREDGRTPGMAYADEKGLSDELKGKIKGLGNAIKGTFEVVRAEQAAFKFVAKNRETEEMYEVRGDIPDIEEGLIFTGTLYPWGDFYLIRGILKMHDTNTLGDQT